MTCPPGSPAARLQVSFQHLGCGRRLHPSILFLLVQGRAASQRAGWLFTPLRAVTHHTAAHSSWATASHVVSADFNKEEMSDQSTHREARGGWGVGEQEDGMFGSPGTLHHRCQRRIYLLNWKTTCSSKEGRARGTWRPLRTRCSAGER